MKSKSNFPQRRAMRLRDYDYSQPGAYFVTICARHRKCLFGAITDGKMRLNEIGQIVVECWNHIQQHFPSVELGESVIMPNHFHGIISWGITETRTPHPSENINTGRGEVSSSVDISPTTRRGEVPSPSLGKIMAYFKYQSTKHINRHYNTPGTRIWQRNYHDHIIRDDPDLQRLRQYMQNNPMKWELDQLHPDNPSRW
ncbi:transposase [Candidatus Poribacteria bacterium]|nr:transposase [Candidatus Poribacteria bacterium]MYH79471.1 transposase [Candidatus Poribacteria bacterium]MYK95476.1 transposase [Candidatus Poribacteria bacterium]